MSRTDDNNWGKREKDDSRFSKLMTREGVKGKDDSWCSKVKVGKRMTVGFQN